ncbi:MAG: hypothetical protein K2X55_17190 [Burkholderiaceae bacterium]|nr:hypothetical protein [Burkholderiaceae bacterium]
MGGVVNIITRKNSRGVGVKAPAQQSLKHAFLDHERKASLAGKSINVAAPGCAPENLKGGLCFYDYWQDKLARVPAQRATFLGSGRLKVSGGTTAYGELQVTKTRNNYNTAPRRSNVNRVPLSWYDSPSVPVARCASGALARTFSPRVQRSLRI